MFISTLIAVFSIFIFLYLVLKSNFSSFFKILIIGTVLVESIYSTIYLLNYYPKERIYLIFGIFLSLYFLFAVTRENNASTVSYTSKLSDIIKKLSTTKIGVFLFILFLSLELFLGDKIISLTSGSLLACSIIWIFYKKIPSSYSFERDLLFVFLHIWSLIGVLFPFLYNRVILTIFFPDTFEPSLVYEFLLMRPLIAILTSLGYVVSSEGQLLYYQDLEKSLTTSVFIGRECSGLASLAIFLSLFLSFVIIHYTFSELRNNIGTIVLMIFTGTAMAYISNILRIIFIILAGHYYGSEMLLFTHHYLGWFIFTIWISIFWYLYSGIISNEKINTQFASDK